MTTVRERHEAGVARLHALFGWDAASCAEAVQAKRRSFPEVERARRRATAKSQRIARRTR